MCRSIDNIALKRPVPENVFHSPIAKKPKIEMEMKDEEAERKAKREAERETFLCRFCGQEIARDDDLLLRLELHASFGFFRARFYNSLIFLENLASDPGFGSYYEHVHCLSCFNILGAIIIDVPPQEVHFYGGRWQHGYYLMIMNNLRIRRGNVLLDAVTREEVN